MSLSPALTEFLADLADNNNREWFNANKTRYERDVKEPLLAFIESFAPELASVSPNFNAIGKGKGSSMFRIYRDTRFSKDKTPYKTHAALQFRHSLTSRDVHGPGFYIHFEPGSTGIGAGMWSPDRVPLRQLREAIVADSEAWRRVWSATTEDGWSWYGDDSLKRPPKGFPPEHEHIEMLKRKSFAVTRSIDPAEAFEPGFAERLAGYFAEIAPLMAFQCRAVGLPY